MRERQRNRRKGSKRRRRDMGKRARKTDTGVRGIGKNGGREWTFFAIRRVIPGASRSW